MYRIHHRLEHECDASPVLFRRTTDRVSSLMIYHFLNCIKTRTKQYEWKKTNTTLYVDDNHVIISYKYIDFKYGRGARLEDEWECCPITNMHCRGSTTACSKTRRDRIQFGPQLSSHYLTYRGNGMYVCRYMYKWYYYKHYDNVHIYIYIIWSTWNSTGTMYKICAFKKKLFPHQLTFI